MKTTISMITILVAAFVLSGCAGMTGGSESSICAGVTPEESVICQKIKNPEMVSTALLAANYGAIKSEAYSKEAALKVIAELETIVDQGGVSYLYLVTKAAELLEADEAAAVVIILSPNVDLMASPLPITEFDQGLLRAHLNYQRQLLSVVE